jgi:hypothetical protein
MSQPHSYILLKRDHGVAHRPRKTKGTKGGIRREPLLLFRANMSSVIIIETWGQRPKPRTFYRYVKISVDSDETGLYPK